MKLRTELSASSARSLDRAFPTRDCAAVDPLHDFHDKSYTDYQAWEKDARKFLENSEQ